MSVPTDAELDRFREKTAVLDNGCIEWTGSTMWKGYGRFWYRGRFVRAHRFSYELSSDAVPLLDHLCHNADESCTGGVTCRHRRCVNPFHLGPATSRENVLNSANTPACINSQKTACPSGHPYDATNTLVRKNGQRECRACSREEARRYLAAHREEKNARRRARRATWRIAA